jgi:beta-lactamase class A
MIPWYRVAVAAASLLLACGVCAAGAARQAASDLRQPAEAHAAQASRPSAVLKDSVSRRLEETAARVDGVVTYAIQDLTSGERFERQADIVVPTASVIKLAILYELFRQAGEERLALDETLPLDRTHAVTGGLLYELGTPALSLRDLAVAMIVLSDNTAANVLIDRLGADRINASLRELGLQDTHLRRRMIDLEAAQRGDENVATAREVASLLEWLHQGRGLTPRSRAELLDILRKPKRSPLRRGLPPSIEAASKSGGLDGVRADAAIVYAPNRPYVFVVMTTFLADDEAGEAVIGELSRLAFGYFSRLGAASEYGRPVR